LRVGLVGYYGYDEYSDDLIAKGIMDAFNEEYELLRHHNIEWVIMPLGSGSYDNLDLVILGGGSLLGLDLYPLIDGLKKHPNLKFCILGTGTRDLINLESTKYLFNRTPYVAIRGDVTAENLATIGCDVEKIEVLGDSIFLHYDEFMFRESYLGITHRTHAPPSYHLMNELISYLQEITGFKPTFIPYCVKQGDVTDGKNYTMEQVYEMTCKSSFWFGNRLHPFAIALINHVPAIPVEIEFNKVQDLCSTIGFKHYIHHEELSLKTLHRTYIDLMNNWDKIDVQCNDQIDRVRNKYKSLITELVAWSRD